MINPRQVRIHVTLFFFLLLRASLGFAQSMELSKLENRLKENAPQSKEGFELCMELNKIFVLTPISKDKTEQLILDTFIPYIEETMAWVKTQGTPTQLAQTQRLLIDIYLYTDQINEFLKLTGEMIAANTFATQEDKRYVYGRLAPIYLDIGHIEKFIELTEELHSMQKELDQPESYLAVEHSHIARAYYRLKDYKRARRYYQKALKALEEGKNLLAIASAANNIGLTYTEEYKRDSAVIYFTKALTILETGGTPEDGFGSSAYNQHFKNRIEANIAMLGIRDGHFDVAITAVKKELESSIRQSEHETIIESCNKLGLLHYHKMNYPLALEYLDQASQKVHPQHQNNLLLENWRIRYKVLLASGQQRAGERVYSKLVALQDSITSAARDNSAMVASIAYETGKKENALKEQKKLLDRQQTEITKRKQQQLTYITGIIGMGILLFITYYFLHKVRTQKAKIEQQKQALDKSLSEKEILLKEVHHRVKNNLQVVSSIMARQGLNSEDVLVKKYMEEGQNRIRSMAMIHQQLYQTNDFQNINLSEYTRLMLINIADYYKLEERKIDIDVNVPDLLFPVDVAIPYGLILNELVSNCYEYGFAGKDRGKLKVAVDRLDDRLFQLSVSDNGNGLPEDIEKRSEKSLGLNLVKGIAWQLRGKLHYYNTQPGSTFEVTFVNDLKQVS